MLLPNAGNRVLRKSQDGFPAGPKWWRTEAWLKIRDSMLRAPWHLAFHPFHELASPSVCFINIPCFYWKSFLSFLLIVSAEAWLPSTCGFCWLPSLLHKKRANWLLFGYLLLKTHNYCICGSELCTGSADRVVCVPWCSLAWDYVRWLLYSHVVPNEAGAHWDNLHGVICIGPQVPLLSVFLSKQSQDLTLPVTFLLISAAEYLDFLCQLSATRSKAEAVLR